MIRSFKCSLYMFIWLSVIDKKMAHPNEIDHLRYVVDFRSAVELPYDHRSVANTDTCFAPNILGGMCTVPSLYGVRWPACQYAVRRQTWTTSSSVMRKALPSSRRQILRCSWRSYDNTYLIQNPAGNNDMDGVQVEHVLQQVPHIPFLLYTNRRYLRR